MSCLFNSLTKLLEYEFQGFYEDTKLRDIVCDYIRERPNDEINGCKISEWFDLITMDEFGNQIDKSDYVNRMRNNSTWGGAPEMSIISKLFNVEIHVIYKKKLYLNFLVVIIIVVYLLLNGMEVIMNQLIELTYSIFFYFSIRFEIYFTRFISLF